MTRVSRVVFALAAGCFAAGAIECLRTLRALGRLQFVPSADQPLLFSAWTSAMVWSAVIVMASAAVLMLARLTFISGIAVAATLVLAARVWENLSGYLISNDAIAFEEHPLPFERWPLIYRHPWPLMTLLAIAMLAAIIYAGSRARPSLFAIVTGVFFVLTLVVAGGQIGFALVSFLRLRNWSLVVAALDTIVAALAVRTRRDIPIVVVLALVITAAIEMALAWQGMRPMSSTLPANAIPHW